MSGPAFCCMSVQGSLAISFPASRAIYPCIYGFFMGQAESKLHLSPKYFLLPRFPLLPGQLLTLVPKALVMIYGVLVFGQATFFSCHVTRSSQPFLR